MQSPGLSLLNLNAQPLPAPADAADIPDSAGEGLSFQDLLGEQLTGDGGNVLPDDDEVVPEELVGLQPELLPALPIVLPIAKQVDADVSEAGEAAPDILALIADPKNSPVVARASVEKPSGDALAKSPPELAVTAADEFSVPNAVAADTVDVPEKAVEDASPLPEVKPLEAPPAAEGVIDEHQPALAAGRQPVIEIGTPGGLRPLPDAISATGRRRAEPIAAPVPTPAASITDGRAPAPAPTPESAVIEVSAGAPVTLVPNPARRLNPVAEALRPVAKAAADSLEAAPQEPVEPVIAEVPVETSPSGTQETLASTFDMLKPRAVKPEIEGGLAKSVEAVVQGERGMPEVAQTRQAPVADGSSSVMPPSAAAVPGASPATSPVRQVPITTINAHQIELPLAHPQWGDSLAARVTWLARHDIQQAEIQLSPADLGPIEIKVAINNGEANVAFNAHHGSTREAIEQSLSRLRDMFAQNGVQLGQVNVSGQSPERGTQGSGQFGSQNGGGGGSYGLEAESTEGTEERPLARAVPQDRAVDYYI